MLERNAEGRRICRRLVAIGAAVLLCPSPLRAASAQSEMAAVAQSDVRVWYRSSDGCPDGAAFITLLGRLGRVVALAGVGDRVDFVVTLAHSPERSTGRLERQSSDRTVAIRDAAAASCEAVAEVLALSLDLALGPGAADARAASEPRPGVESPAPAAATSFPPGAAAGRDDVSARGTTEPAASSDAAWRPRIGAEGTLTTGVARTVLLGGAAFFTLGLPSDSWGLRFSLGAALGERHTAVPLNVGLLASRLEACWTWGMGDVSLGPCAGVQLGVVRAEASGPGARTDSGFWSAGLLQGQLGWRLGPAIALDARIGALAPFTRYRFEAVTGGEVSGSAAVGLDAALGLSFRL